MTHKTNLCNVVLTAGHCLSGRHKSILGEGTVPIDLPFELDGLARIFFRMLADIQIPETKIIILQHNKILVDIIGKFLCNIALHRSVLCLKQHLRPSVDRLYTSPGCGFIHRIRTAVKDHQV